MIEANAAPYFLILKKLRMLSDGLLIHDIAQIFRTDQFDVSAAVVIGPCKSP